MTAKQKQIANKLIHKHMARQALAGAPHADLLKRPLDTLTQDHLSLNYIYSHEEIIN